MLFLDIMLSAERMIKIRTEPVGTLSVSAHCQIVQIHRKISPVSKIFSVTWHNIILHNIFFIGTNDYEVNDIDE